MLYLAGEVYGLTPDNLVNGFRSDRENEMVRSSCTHQQVLARFDPGACISCRPRAPIIVQGIIESRDVQHFFAVDVPLLAHPASGVINERVSSPKHSPDEPGR